MRKRRWLLWTSIPVLIGALGLCGIYFLLRPAPMARTEIYNGIYLTVEDYPGDGPVRGRVMIVEIHWDTPGVELVPREFSRLSMASENGHHFKTIPADLVLEKEHAEVLINTTIFVPNSLKSFIPGCKVRSVDTLIANGRTSHIHEHSYLLYWDTDDNAKMLTEKPPPQEDLDRAVWGFGIQGVQIKNGLPNYQSIDSLDSIESRAFIGIDPDNRVLYLVAMEHASGKFAIDRSIEAGMVYGGQLDTGKTTHLLIGSGAPNILPHTGIRNIRPLGHYLAIQADPLKEE